MSNSNDETQQTQQPKITKQNTKLTGLIGVLSLMTFNLGLPIAIVFVLKKYMSMTYALIIASASPLFVVAYGLIRKRFVDTTGIVTIIGLNTSALVAAVENRYEPLMQIVLGAAVMGLIGTLYLITLIPFKIGSFQLRPMNFYFAKDTATGGAFGFAGPSELKGLTDNEPIADRWDRHWNSYPLFRRTYRIVTAVWGVGLLIQVPIRVILIHYVQPFERISLISNMATLGSIVLIVIFTPLYAKFVKIRGRKAAAKAGIDVESA